MFADIGFGFISAVVLADLFGVSLDTWVVVLSVILSLLPDFDFVLAVFNRLFSAKGRDYHDHREISHFPLVYLLLSVIVFVVGGLFAGTLFAVNVLWHFLHDSVGIGWGVKWLWPFSNNTYKFFTRQDNELGWRHFSRTPTELESAKALYGRKDWIRYYYFQPTTISVSEFAIFILGIIILFVSVQ